MSKERAFVGALLNHAFVQLLIRRVCTLNLGDSSSECSYMNVYSTASQQAGHLLSRPSPLVPPQTTSDEDRYGSPTAMDFDGLPFWKNFRFEEAFCLVPIPFGCLM